MVWILLYDWSSQNRVSFGKDSIIQLEIFGWYLYSTFTVFWWLLLEGSTCSHKQYTFLDLYIRVVDHNFVTGTYHKVDDFYFEVISYPFPQSNVHLMLGYSTYYSQPIRFLDCAITSLISCFGQNLATPNWSNVAISIVCYWNILSDFVRSIIQREIWRENIRSTLLAYAQTQSLFSCDIHNIKEINDSVKATYVKSMPLTRRGVLSASG